MAMGFGVEEARNQLEEKGFVYTLRPYIDLEPHYRQYNYFRGDNVRGEVYVIFIGDYYDNEGDLVSFVQDSGFKSLDDWLEKAKGSRYLYKVTKVRGCC